MTDTELNQEGTASADEILAMLKTKADNMGLTYSARIGVDALREKINKHLAGDEDDKSEDPVETLTAAQAAIKRRNELILEANKQVRLRVANLNPMKKDYPGEFFTVANNFVGIIKKFVPYGEATDNGYHVPFAIYKMMKARKYLSIKTKMVKGQIVVTQRWVPEFALEVLDQLTPTELKRLQVQQAAAAGQVDEDE